LEKKNNSFGNVYFIYFYFIFLGAWASARKEEEIITTIIIQECKIAFVKESVPALVRDLFTFSSKVI
jgi:hypothetical protein